MSTVFARRAAALAATGLTIVGILAAPGTANAHVLSAPEQRHHIRTRALEAIGAPYSYGGSSPAGFDCSGFTMWVFERHGISLPHSSLAQFELAGRKGFQRIWKMKDLEVGDLVFHDTSGGIVGHAGIYIGRGRFVSSTSSEGVQIRSLNDRYWGPRWVGATRLPLLRGDETGTEIHELGDPEELRRKLL